MICVEIEGIKGNVTAAGHEDWIEVDALQWGVGRSVAMDVGGGKEREATKPSFSEVTLSKSMDKSSPFIFTEACTGKGKKAKIHVVKTSGDQLETFLEYTLENTLITSYSVSSNGDTPFESISLNFTSFDMKFTHWKDDHTADSPITAGYDIAAGKKK